MGNNIEVGNVPVGKIWGTIVGGGMIGDWIGGGDGPTTGRNVGLFVGCNWGVVGLIWFDGSLVGGGLTKIGTDEGDNDDGIDGDNDGDCVDGIFGNGVVDGCVDGIFGDGIVDGRRDGILSVLQKVVGGETTDISHIVWRIHCSYALTRVYIAGRPGRAHPVPVETIPTCISFVVNNGPPESP